MFDVGEGLGRSKNDGVVGVNFDRVKVFYGVDYYGVVSVIVYYFVFNFFEFSD